MSLTWSTSDPSSTALGEAEGPSLGAITVAELPEGQFSPRGIVDSADTGESISTGDDDAEVASSETLVFPKNSLLHPSSNVEGHTVARMAGIKTEMQPLHAVSNSTVSAAADSSDNQPPTPTPDHQPPPQQQQQHHPHHQQQQQHHHQQQQHHHQQQQHHHQQQQQHHQHPLYGSGGSIANSNQMYQDMHSYHPPAASYLGGYEQFYHAPPAGVDYGSAMQQLQQNSVLSYQMQNQPLTGAASPHGEYKLMPSSQRYHPYLNNGGLHHLPPAQNHSVAAVVSANSGATVNNASSSVSNSSLSPRVVSSSSPSQNNSAANTPHHGLADVNSMANRTPTPSASKQCNKCGVMCATETELNEHYSALHGAQSGEDCINSAERSASSASERGQYHPFAPYIKEEPPSSDILDLDSQKMVYPPQSDGDVVNAGLHPMQRPMGWPQELHPAYMTAPHIAENKHAGYYVKQEFSAIKSEFHPIKTEYVSPTNFGNSSLKVTGGDYGQPIAPQTRPDDKPFVSTDLATGSNPVSSSPSEFPSTTTPQDNLTQYRGFEPPSSSLPSSGSSAKSATWKSNEARRPKTYNCTACNKWFTSSGHLKRHYNTTLHKNAVKSSGQPDPATMPISAHHHPSRDPNSKHHRNSQSRQPPPIPPEPPRSPDFSSQYTTQSPNGFPPQQQQQQSQSFQQYHPQSNLNSSVNGHPNGLAGPSVQASQPRGLLTITSTEVSIMDQEEDQLHSNSSSSSNNSNNNLHLQEDQYHQQQQQEMPQESSPNSSPNNNSNSSLEDYPSTISLHQQQQSQQQQLLPPPPLQSPHIISHHQYREVHPIHHHQQEPTIFNTDTTIHNIMEQQPPLQQQQYIISPLAINTTTPITLNNTTTTIPSFQHLQQPAAEHQQSYHTIIGNDAQNLSNGGGGSQQDTNLIQLSSFVDISTLAGGQTFQGNSHQQMHQQMVALDANGQIVQLIHQPSMVDIQRYSGGVPSFRENLMQATSPAAPESYYNRMSPFVSHGSPQEADIPPMHSTASGPQNDQGNPYSPTVSSSTATTTNQLAANVGEKITSAVTTNRKPAAKRKREPASKATSTTLPTGRIKCVECDKEFTKICYLTQHNKSFHSGELPYRCQKCGKRFQSEEIYDAHLARHKSQDKPHKCDICPKQFHHKTDLRRHKEAIHTGFKAHTCDMCNKSFCRKDHLRKHCDIHNRPKPVKKAKVTAANRKQSLEIPAPTTAIYPSERNSPILISNVEDSTNSSSSQSHLMPKLEIIKVESFSMVGEELVYM